MSSNPLPSSFDGNTDFYEENRWQKFSRRLKEEPLVPLGCLLTCAALLGATRSIRAGDHNKTNRMFRARILAQGFTLVAMVVGSIYWDSDRKKRKEFDGLVLERKAKEKNQAWIRELEARDEEDREIRAARKRRMEGLVPVEKVKTKLPEGKSVLEKVEDVVEEAAAKGKGVLDSKTGVFAGKFSGEDPKTPKGGASSMIDECEERRLGLLELVEAIRRRN